MALPEDLPFKVVRDIGGQDEILARSASLIIARGAYGAAVGMYPRELIELRNGALVVQNSREP